MSFQRTGSSGAAMGNSGVLKGHGEELSIKSVLVSGSTLLVMEVGSVISE